MTKKNNKFKFDPKKWGTGFKKKAYFGKKRKIIRVDRGFWMTHLFIRNDDRIHELNVKNSLKPTGGINVHMINDMISGRITREENLLQREKLGETFNTRDTIRLKSYHEKRSESIKNDIKSLESKEGIFRSSPKTIEGRFVRKMRLLKLFCDNNNKVKIAHMYLKIKDDEDNLATMDLDEELKKEFNILLDNVQLKIDSYDMVDMQLNELANFVTPLNITGFKKLEDFQVRVIQIIQENETKPVNEKTSILVKAPTSSGKTALAGYLFTLPLCKIMVVVPTNALAWQLSAYISSIMKRNVPLVTDTFQSALKMSDLVDLVLKNNCVVGTAKELVDILACPEFKDISWDYMMVDEVHMMGHQEGAEMEHLIKAFPETPLLGLSATIGNEVELGKWLESCGRPNVEIITYDKRFINLQRFRYNQTTKDIDRINSLSMSSVDSFLSGEVLSKSIVPTPQDVYDTYQRILKIFPNEESIKHQTFFESDRRLSLDDISCFFNHQLKFMVSKVQEGNKDMINLIQSIQLNSFEKQEVNLVDMLFCLKEKNKCPALIFHKNSSIIMDRAFKIHNEITRREIEAHPKMYIERMKNNKKFKQQRKKDDRDETMKRINDSSKESDKLLARIEKKQAQAEKEGKSEERITETDIYAPHPDFILNKHQYISKAIVQSWEERVNPRRDTYFPRDGECYHWILMLLYRGIGIYCKGLPDPYLRIVQQMANDKLLAHVLSDKELCFGVDMGFRTAVILGDLTLNSMEYHQMVGRAGRRGHDKEGNVIFVQQSSDRIRELSISVIPNVTGSKECIHYGVKVAEMFSENKRWNNTNKNMLISLNNEEHKEKVNNFFEGIEYNQDEEEGVWGYINKISNKSLLHLLWQFRQTQECMMLPKVLEHFENGFAGARSDNEADQVSAAHYLLHYIEAKEVTNTAMPIHSLISGKHSEFYNSLKDHETGYGFYLPDEIDGDTLRCIVENRCIDKLSILEKHTQRNNIYNFINKLRFIQHYYYNRGLSSGPDQSKYKNICKLLGKLFTRLKWIYHTSSKLVEK